MTRNSKSTQRQWLKLKVVELSYRGNSYKEIADKRTLFQDISKNGCDFRVHFVYHLFYLTFRPNHMRMLFLSRCRA